MSRSIPIGADDKPDVPNNCTQKLLSTGSYCQKSETFTTHTAKHQDDQVRKQGVSLSGFYQIRSAVKLCQPDLKSDAAITFLSLGTKRHMQ
jgi:hypothetical protein